MYKTVSNDKITLIFGLINKITNADKSCFKAPTLK